jgi:protein-S-isoprenylcysteine O-methyltransferase Ste14
MKVIQLPLWFCLFYIRKLEEEKYMKAILCIWFVIQFVMVDNDIDH